MGKYEIWCRTICADMRLSCNTSCDEIPDMMRYDIWRDK